MFKLIELISILELKYFIDNTSSAMSQLSFHLRYRECDTGGVAVMICLQANRALRCKSDRRWAPKLPLLVHVEEKMAAHTPD